MKLPLRIFVSSVQKELAAERSALRDYLSGDVLMRRCREAGLREPEIRIDHDVWITTIWRKNAAGAQLTDPVNRPSSKGGPVTRYRRGAWPVRNSGTPRAEA